MIILQGGFSPTVDQRVAIGVIAGTAALVGVAALGCSLIRCARNGWRWWMAPAAIAG